MEESSKKGVPNQFGRAHGECKTGIPSIGVYAMSRKRRGPKQPPRVVRQVRERTPDEVRIWQGTGTLSSGTVEIPRLGICWYDPFAFDANQIARAINSRPGVVYFFDSTQFIAPTDPLIWDAIFAEQRLAKAPVWRTTHVSTATSRAPVAPIAPGSRKSACAKLCPSAGNCQLSCAKVMPRNWMCCTQRSPAMSPANSLQQPSLPGRRCHLLRCENRFRQRD